jgi:hypothetical protein
MSYVSGEHWDPDMELLTLELTPGSAHLVHISPTSVDDTEKDDELYRSVETVRIG